MERYPGPIVVREYDPDWPAAFDLESGRLRDVLGPMVMAIEHVGSTSVPGSAAKPIIDIAVAVHSLHEARSGCVEALRALGYRYMAEYESWLPGEMLFRKAVGGPWTHHLHVMESSSPRWDELILIRDHLRRHSEIARAYGDLKKALAVLFVDDIAGFRNAKRPFLEAVMAKARSERSTVQPLGEGGSRR